MAGPLGLTRNLTLAFKQQRERAHGGATEQRGVEKLLGSAIQMSDAPAEANAPDIERGATSIYMGLDVPWMGEADAIKVGLKRLKATLNELRALHGQGSLVSFDADDSGAAIHERSEQCKAMIRAVEAKVKGLGRYASDRYVTADDAAVVRNVQKQLANTLFQLSNDFRKQEIRFMNKRAEAQGISPGVLGMVDDGMDGDDDPGFSQAQLQRVEDAYGMIAERDREMEELMKSITEIAGIMKDLSVLVVEQGTMLDRIDHNITCMAEKVESGLTQLRHAERKQKNTLMMNCILLLVALILLMIVILVIKAIISF